jgi:hypothetical protein
VQSPEDKLRAEDPFFEHPYEHPDLEGMISRITAAPTDPMGSVRRLKVRMLATGLAATLLAVGAVATLDAVSTTPASLVPVAAPVLVGPRALPSHGAVATSKTAAAAYSSDALTVAKGMWFVPPGVYRFEPAPSLSRLAGTGVGYRVTEVVSGALEAHRLASHFKVPGPVRVSASHWTVGSAADRVVGYGVVGGIPTFFYNVNRDGAATARDGAPVPADRMPGPAAVESAAKSLVKSLGVAYQLTTLSYGIGWTNPRYTPCAEACSEVDASYEVLVGGADTGLQLQLAVDHRGRVVSASGPVILGVAPYEFPLRSPASGVADLTKSRPWSEADRVVAGAPVAQLPVVIVRVERAIRAVALYRTATGALWLLPTYGYAGSLSLHRRALSLTPDTLSVLAVAPGHLRPPAARQRGAPVK